MLQRRVGSGHFFHDLLFTPEAGIDAARRGRPVAADGYADAGRKIHPGTAAEDAGIAGRLTGRVEALRSLIIAGAIPITSPLPFIS